MRERVSRSLRSCLVVAALATSGLALSGCTTVVSEAVSLGLEDRTSEDQIQDSSIHGEILQRFAEVDKDLVLDLNVNVWEGRVLLTGVLNDRKLHAEARRLIRKDKRIRALIDEVQIVSKAAVEARRKQAKAGDKKEKSAAGQAVSDFWIESKIKVQMIGAEGVSSVNYRWRSVFNRVYVIGRAGSAGEKKKVLSLIGKTEGVKTLRSYIKIKPLKKS